MPSPSPTENLQCMYSFIFIAFISAAGMTSELLSSQQCCGGSPRPRGRARCLGFSPTCCCPSCWSPVKIMGTWEPGNKAHELECCQSCSERDTKVWLFWLYRDRLSGHSLTTLSMTTSWPVLMCNKHISQEFWLATIRPTDPVRTPFATYLFPCRQTHAHTTKLGSKPFSGLWKCCHP